VAFPRVPAVQVAASFARLDQDGRARRVVRIETRSPARDVMFSESGLWSGLDADVVAFVLTRQVLQFLHDAATPREGREMVLAWARRVVQCVGKEEFCKSDISRLVFGLLRSPELQVAATDVGFARPKLAHLLDPAVLSRYLYPRLTECESASAHGPALPLTRHSLQSSRLYMLDAVTHVLCVGPGFQSRLAALPNPYPGLETVLGGLDLASSAGSGSAAAGASLSPFAQRRDEDASLVALEALLYVDGWGSDWPLGLRGFLDEL
jgi:hypothetical protein